MILLLGILVEVIQCTTTPAYWMNLFRLVNVFVYDHNFNAVIIVLNNNLCNCLLEKWLVAFYIMIRTICNSDTAFATSAE